jgi:CheY-like chemotaxis protein
MARKLLPFESVCLFRLLLLTETSAINAKMQDFMLRQSFRFALWVRAAVFGLMLSLAVMLCCTTAPATAQGSAEAQKPGSEAASKVVQPPPPSEGGSYDLDSDLTNQFRTMTEQLSLHSKASSPHITFLIIASLLAVGALLITRWFPVITAFLGSRSPAEAMAPVAVSKPSYDALAEKQAYTEFAANLRAGPKASRTQNSSKPAPSAAERFLERSREEISAARRQLLELNQAADPVTQHKILSDLFRQITFLKTCAGVPELLPIWQLVSALEALIKHLIDKPGSVTPSTVRTLSGAVELVHTCSHSEVPPGLLTDRCVRVLAVDDDAICRHALSFALKKAFPSPDLVADGEAALTLAEQYAYDALFLDIQLPGIDGFELCSRIHKTKLNHQAPVVFVTCHSDFATSEKLELAGGQELIGKPFLIFEITLKALTLVLQGRLKKNAGAGNRSLAANGAQSSSSARAPKHGRAELELCAPTR